MSYQPLIKAAGGALACYVAPRAISYAYNNRIHYISERNLNRIHELGQRLAAPPKAIPKGIRAWSKMLRDNPKDTTLAHIILFIYKIFVDSKADTTPLHLLLTPRFTDGLAETIEAIPRFAKYSAKVIHDNQWMVHLAFCYFFFNGQIALKGSTLAFQYSKYALMGSIGIDLSKALVMYLTNLEQNDYFFANRLHGHQVA